MAETHSILEQYQERFFDYAAEGDIEQLKAAMKVVPNKNLKNDRGWTAMMFAARNGHISVVKLLIDEGCDAYMINNNGHTALDIAKFWNHGNIAELLSPSHSGEGKDDRMLPGLNSAQKPNYFSTNFLDRAAHRRKDKAWLEEKMKDRKTKFILFSDLQPVVIPLPDNSLGKKQEHLRLLDVYCDDIADLLAEDHVLIFLGEESAKRKDQPKIAWFALNFQKISEDRIYKLHPHAMFLGMFPAAMQMVEKEAGILAQARSVFAWHDRYQFCPTCGSRTEAEEAGYKRQCVREECRSRKGVHNTSYPRVDPTVIMAVISPDKSRILLGRGSRFPKAMWSCLAGFMEPGESIEDACRREVAEEAGVTVGHVEYHSCQPWPMPASLMIGCLGYATSMNIKIDPEELQEARWFTRQEAVQMLTHTHPNNLFCPPEQALAHQLIRAWVARTSNL